MEMDENVCKSFPCAALLALFDGGRHVLIHHDIVTFDGQRAASG